MRTSRSFLHSPLLAKDTLAQGRSWTTAGAVIAEICVLSGFAYVMFTVAFGPDSLHRALFAVLAFQLAVTTVLAASLAAGTISGERERGTLEFLLLGRLRPFEIVAAKFTSSMSWSALLVVSAVPVLLAAFLHVGLGFGPLVATLLVTATSATVIGALALLISACARRTPVSLIGSYAGAVVFCLGTALAGLVVTPDTAGGAVLDVPADAHPVLFANPVYALYSSVTPGWETGSHVGQLAQLFFSSDGTPSSWGLVLQPWQLAVALQLVLTALLLSAATHVVDGLRTSAPRRRHRRPSVRTA